MGYAGCHGGEVGRQGSDSSVFTFNGRLESCELSSRSRCSAAASCERSCSISDTSSRELLPWCETDFCAIACRRAFSCSSSATRLQKHLVYQIWQEKRFETHTSMFSNSSRFLWRLRKAAALFFTRRASRLLSPVTSGGTKSLVLTRSPEARGFFVVVLDRCSGLDGRLTAGAPGLRSRWG